MKERKEDKEERMSMTKEISDVVRKEMLETMQPWQERTLRAEESAVKLGEMVRRLAEEVTRMKEKLAERQEEVSFASVAGAEQGRRQGRGCTALLTGANTVQIGGSRGEQVREEVEEEVEEAHQYKSKNNLEPRFLFFFSRHYCTTIWSKNSMNLGYNFF